MRRTILAAALTALALPFPGLAGVTRPEIAGPATVRNQTEDRWSGRWVVTRVETRADCAGIYTDNLAGGRRVSSQGRERFSAGTPARVDSVDLTRSRISLRLTLSELLLVTRQHPDVTLRDEARCQIELKVLVPPGLVEGGDLIGLDSLLEPFVDLHASEVSALLASSFLPVAGVDHVAARREAVAAHQQWKDERAARAYEARLDEWVSQTARLSGKISSDPDYLDGFARGVEAGRAGPAHDCADLVRYGPAIQAGGVSPARAAKGRRQKAWVRGYEDGVRLAQGLQALEIMPQCAPSASPLSRSAPGPIKAKSPARPKTAVPTSSSTIH